MNDDTVNEAAQVVTIDYADVMNPSIDLSDFIAKAFGGEPTSLGLLLVVNVPDLGNKREKLLRLVREFAVLPREIRDKYEHPSSNYQFGWSHGKESMAKGVPDWAKGSYYFNPLNDTLDDPDNLVGEHPTFFSQNLWPEEVNLKEPAKELSGVVVTIGRALMVHCDQYIRTKLPSYPEYQLSNILKSSRFGKGRMLHYYPSNDSVGSWCGWHNDHCALTGLVPAMYFTKDGEVTTGNSGSGLYIRNRNGDDVHGFPEDSLAFQIGETSQIISGGVLEATPHHVKAVGLPSGVSRETLAVFMEPEHDQLMTVPKEVDPRGMQEIFRRQRMPDGVPSLADRFQPNMTFGHFASTTIASYYP